MAEKTQVYHFALGMPYIPPKDFRLARAKWESQKLYINGLPAFFHLHLQREDRYYSYAQIFCRPIVNNKRLNIRQIGYVNTSAVGKSLEKMADFHQYQEYFLTANSFSTPKERKKKNLYTIQNIVLDIDIHSAKRDREVFVQRLDAVLYLAFKDKTFPLPVPNTVVYTGRGIQLWWAVCPFSAKELLYVYHDLVRYFASEITKRINEDKELKKYVIVDAAASKKESGLFRMPGTWNAKSRTFGSFRILHENKFDAVTLFFDRHPKTGKPFIKYKSKRKNGFRDYGKYMEEKIRHLIKLRREEGLEENGFRDLYCLIVYCAYLSSGTAEEIAWEKTMALNESFQHPLLEKELRNYMSSATEKKYRFTFEKVIEYLDIDKKEQETIHLKPAGVRKKEHEMAKKRAEENRRRRKEEKEKKKRCVLELFMKGYTQQKIAGIIGCTQSTVSKTINEAGIKCKKGRRKINESAKKICQIIHNKKEEKQKANIHAEMDYLMETDLEFCATMDKLNALKKSRERYRTEKEELNERRKTPEWNRIFDLPSEVEFQKISAGEISSYNEL